MVFFPASLTNSFVLVAIPDRWDKKFKATLSAINIELALPFIVAITAPLLTWEPSFFLIKILTLLSTLAKACFAKIKPAIIAF